MALAMASCGGGARGAQWMAALALAACVGPDEPAGARSFGRDARAPFAAEEQSGPAGPSAAAGTPTRRTGAAGMAPKATVPVVMVPSAEVPVAEVLVAEVPGAAVPSDRQPGRGDPTEAAAAKPPAGGAVEAIAEDPAAAVVSLPAPPAAEPSPTEVADDGRGEERTLRNAFANATDVTEPALKLASFLVRKERYPEARHVLDQAIDRIPADQRAASSDLRLARAGLLRDVARNDLAMVELRAVVRERGRSRVAPGTLFELAQVEWLAGEREAANVTMRDLLRLHVDSAFLVDNAAWLREWHVRIENRTVADDGGELRDAFALLRAAPVVTGRMRILDALARPQASGPDDGRRPVRLRAIGIACADESPAVRTRAVQLADANGLDNLVFWRAAMADDSPLVRRFGAYGAARQHGERAAGALLRAMADEQDPSAFAGMHAAMARALSVDAPPCAAENEEGRSNAVAMWRKQCER